MRRRFAVLVSTLVVAVGVGAFFFISRHYRLVELAPAELALKQPKPPDPPKDCYEIRRALELSTASVSSALEQPVRIAAPLDADEAAIYSAVIEQWNAGNRTTLNISNRTFPIEVPRPFEQRECGCLAGFSAESLLKASHSFHLLTSRDLPLKGIRLVNSDEQSKIIERNDPGGRKEGEQVPEAVETAFTTALFSLSEIAFDQGYRHALVSYAFRCGALCGSGSTWVFEKVNGRWKKADIECGGWAS